MACGYGLSFADQGFIYTSSDSGVTWTPSASSKIGPDGYYIVSSSDGSKLAATVAFGPSYEFSRPSFIYTSSDSGVTWTAQPSGSKSWQAIASSSDGTKLAGTAFEPIYVSSATEICTSSDAGVTWTAQASGTLWSGIASSSDGNKLAATVSGGQIYTGTKLLSGFQGTMATFQYTGNGQWVRMVQAP